MLYDVTSVFSFALLENFRKFVPFLQQPTIDRLPGPSINVGRRANVLTRAVIGQRLPSLAECYYMPCALFKPQEFEFYFWELSTDWGCANVLHGRKSIDWVYLEKPGKFQRSGKLGEFSWNVPTRRRMSSKTALRTARPMR